MSIEEARLFESNRVEIKDDSPILPGEGEDEAGLDARQILPGDINGVLFPFASQRDLFEFAAAGVEELLVFAENAEFKADDFFSGLASSPEGQAFGAGQVPTAGDIPPIIRRILPDDAGPCVLRFIFDA